MDVRTTCDLACNDTALATQRRAHLPLGARIAALVRQGWRTYWMRRAQRATLLILSSLDERTLHDIGISPSEIESSIYACGDRRRHYVEGWYRRLR